MNRRILLIAIGVVVLLVPVLIFNINIVMKNRSILAAKQEKANAVVALLNQAHELEGKGSLLEAKSVYQKLINEFSNSSEIMDWQKRIEDINLMILFSPTVIPNKSALYEIKPGDTLIKIARDFKTTPELIMKSNRIVSDKITPGRKIRVWTSPFNIFVDKSQNVLILKNNEEIVKTYIVSTGANNSTPVGVFKIVNKIVDPTWFKAGAVVPPSSPENVLGTRWMGFDLPGYGIHGTIEPQNLGKQVTQGCVRMANAEVEQLYSIVPSGTEVNIVD